MVEPTASIATLTGWLETANEIRVGDLVEVKCQCAGGLEPRCAGRAREILLHNCFTCASIHFFSSWRRRQGDTRRLRERLLGVQGLAQAGALHAGSGELDAEKALQ